VASLSGTAFLWHLVAPDLGVERPSEPCSMTVGFIGWSRGMGGVLVPEDKRNGNGRTSRGERTGLSALFVATG
jgi:hypothetical protein